MRKSKQMPPPGLLVVAMMSVMPLAACRSDAAPGAVALDIPEMPGATLARNLCAGCHATGRTDLSPHPDALPFRQFAQRYDVRTLEEPLAEGIVVGHPDMPPFQLAPDDIDDLLDYIEAIQEPV
jgi:mono/diheme cytochrome c family protein